MVYGIGKDEVAQLVRQRLTGGHRAPGGRKLAVVVEGGAMRGTYTAGSLLGFHLLGASDIFDVAYATSAGAINTAHFLSGVGHLKAATYYKALADGRFFNPTRLPRPVDVDFLFDTVLRKEIPLEMDLLGRSKTVMKVATLNYDVGAGEMKTVPAPNTSAWDVLRAAVAMPVVYNKTVSLTGGRYVDGGVAIPYPLFHAINDGMTDLVVLLSRDPMREAKPRGLLQYLLWSLIFAKGRPSLIKFVENWHTCARELDTVASGRTAAPNDARILCFAPKNPRVGGSSQDKSALRDGCLEMTREVLDYFGSSHDSLSDLIKQGII